MACVFFALPGLCPQSARAEPGLADCPETRARVMVIVGCDPPSCRSHEPLRRLLAPLLGAPMGQASLRIAEGRLLTSRLATEARLTCEPATGALIAHVTPMPFVRRVALRGNVAFRKRELMKRVFLRPGTPLDLAATPDLEALPPESPLGRQLESLTRLYRQAGLEDASVRVEVTRASVTELDLAFVIREGPRERLGTVRARHLHAAQGGSLCPTISESRLTRLLALHPGDLLTPTTERQIRNTMRSAFQAVGYERPDVSLTLGPADANLGRELTVTVRTERCWLIRLWRRGSAIGPGRPGRRRAPGDQPALRWEDPAGLADPPALARADSAFTREPLAAWSKALPFGESGAFDLGEATRALDALTRALRARGRPFGEVRLVHREHATVAPESRQDVQGVIDYFIDGDRPRRIRTLRLEGVRALPYATLAQAMTTKAYGFFDSDGGFDEARILADLGAIERRGREAGYFGVRFLDGGPSDDAPFVREVLGPEASGGRSWRYALGRRGFRVEIAPREVDLDVVVRLDEGAPLRVASVRLEGFSALPASEVETLLGLKAGDILAPSRLDEGLAQLARRYRALGHVHLALSARCLVREGAGPSASERASDCRDPGLAGAEGAVLLVEADEGRPFRVGSVLWRGAHRTLGHVLTRDLPQPGERLDLDQVQTAIRLMRSLPIFNAVKVDLVGLESPTTRSTTGLPAPDAAGTGAARPDGAAGTGAARPDGGTPPTDALADLVVAVEESQTRLLDLAGGVRSIQRANIGRIPQWAANASGLLVDQADRLRHGFGTPTALDLPDILLTAEVEYADLNVGGRGAQLRMPFIAGFSLSEFLRLATFNPSYTWRRVFDSRMTLTARGLAELDRVTDPLDRLEFGAEGDLLFPAGPRTLVGLNTRASVIRLAVPGAACVGCLTGPPLTAGSASAQLLADETAEETLCAADPTAPGCVDGGFRPQLSVGLRWRHDTFDTPLHPTRGVMVAANTSFILDRDRFAVSPTFNQFLKWEASVRGALRLGPTILAGLLRYGGSLTFGQAFLPRDERFTLGGFNGLRGYSDNGVCRYDADGRLEADCPGEFGGNVIVHGSLELRAPLLPATGLWLGLFTDFGTLARDHGSLRWAGVRASAGVGLRWLLGQLIPVRVDLGFPLLGRRCLAAVDPQTGLCPREAPSAFHVDLLYPF